VKLRIACVLAGFLSLSLSLVQLTVAQTTTETASALPRLVRFGGTVKDLNGNLLTGVVGISFALYSEQTGGAALWLETQNVTADSNGHYVALLGSTKPAGLPTELFTTEQARWVGVQVSGQAEQPRVLLVSAPYALKAGDAETLGGKPASAYALATPQTATSAPTSESAKPSAAVNASTNNQSSIQAAIAGSGATNYIPRWTSSTALGNSNIFQNATNKDIGIGTTTPTATLDVNGTTLLNGASTSTFGLTVSSPAQLGEEIQGPITGVGAGLDFKTTGTGGKQWEILATGNAAIQGVGKFNIRDVNNSTDVLTIDATDKVNIRNLAVSGFITVPILDAALASLGSSGMVSQGPVGIGPEFNRKLPAANLDVQGNGLDTLIGDPGCGANFGGIGFQNTALTNCTNYSMVGDGRDTYVAAPTGNIYFRTKSNTVTPMLVTSSGSVAIGTTTPNAKLDVRGQAGDSGFGIAADSNAWQARGAGGWIKAMAYVDPFASGGIAVTSCYNPQASGAAVTTPPCGIALLDHSRGNNTVDFGFQVSDRFVQLTAVLTAPSYNAGARTVGALMQFDFAGGANANQVWVETFNTNGQGGNNGDVDTPFFIFIY
jgi:hypothetical protein